MAEKFYKDKTRFLKETGEKRVCEYECMECGCVFYGKYHSNYTIDAVKCPICEDSTDSLFLKINDIEDIQ